MIELSIKGNSNSQIRQILNLSANQDMAWQSRLYDIVSSEIPFNVHLAIFVEPYLSYIFEGKKTIESRFSINKIAPYEKVEEQDVLLLKLSGGRILGMCMVQKVWFYELDEKTLTYIKDNFARCLCVQDPNFWIEKEKSSYASLIKIENVVKLSEGIKCEKKDRRGWIIIHEKDKSQKTNSVGGKKKDLQSNLEKWR